MLKVTTTRAYEDKWERSEKEDVVFQLLKQQLQFSYE